LNAREDSMPSCLNSSANFRVSTRFVLLTTGTFNNSPIFAEDDSNSLYVTHKSRAQPRACMCAGTFKSPCRTF